MTLRPVLFALVGVATAASFAAGVVVGINDKPKPADAQPVVAREAASGEAQPLACAAQPPEDTTYKTKVLPFIQKYCVDCHKGEKAKGGLALDGYTSEAAARKDRKNWGAMQHVIASGEMPPPASKKAPQPTKEEKEFIINWIETSLTNVNCSPNTPKDPGRVTIRRLNRAEYNNTIRDLCGVDFKPAEEFPSDDVGYGFDNIGDVLSFQPILLEKYLAAADKILAAAVNIPEPAKSSKQTMSAQSLNVIPRDAKSKDPNVKIVFKSEGSAFREKFNFPAEGEYVIRVRGWGTKVGDAYPQAVVRVDGKDVKTFTVDAETAKPKTYEVTTKFTAGEKRVAVAFTNPFEDKQNKTFREFGLLSIEIEGPYKPVPPPDSDSVKLLLVARPGSGVDARTAAEKVLTNFARRAYRRPVKPDELARLVKLFELATKQGEPFHTALKLPMKAVLVSPHFLYRIEEDPKNPDDVRDHQRLRVRDAAELLPLVHHAGRGVVRARGEGHAPQARDARRPGEADAQGPEGAVRCRRTSRASGFNCATCKRSRPTRGTSRPGTTRSAPRWSRRRNRSSSTSFKMTGRSSTSSTRTTRS